MKRYALLFLGLIAIACGDDETTPIPPSITYDDQAYFGSFYQEGNSSAPEINWQGDSGVVTLVTPIEHIGVDSLTGVVSWNELLPVGTYQLQLRASNTGGEGEVTIEVINQLEGRFQGGFVNGFGEVNFPNKSFITISPDSSLVLESVLSDDVNPGNWWVAADDEQPYRITYTISETKEKRSMFMELTATKTEATIEGTWFDGEFPDDSSSMILVNGEFRFFLVK